MHVFTFQFAVMAGVASSSEKTTPLDIHFLIVLAVARFWSRPVEDAEIVIGSNNIINNNSVIGCTSRVVIGNDCLIGDSVAIYDADFHNLSPERRRDQQFPTAPIILGNNIWIGSRAMILKGVTVGDHSVIGAMSIVTKSIPPRTLVAGNPARIVRELA